MTDERYKLDELARAAGTSPRTVRYYVQRGLLPAPDFRGKDTAYGREHLVRLRAIRHLQEAFYPLDAIAIELEGKTTGELELLAEGKGAAARAKPVPAPPRAPEPRRDPAPPRERTWRRLAIADGLEMSIAADAPPETRRIAERLMEIAEAMSRTKEGANR